MRVIKKVIAYVLAIGMMLTGMQTIALANEDVLFLYDDEQAKGVVVDLFDAANNQNWDKYAELMCNSEKAYYEYYFSDSELVDGIKQIRSANLLNVYYVENELAKEEWLTEEYPILKNSSETYSFIAQAECTVGEENKYFFEGVNYFFVVLCVEEGELRVVQFNRPSYDLLTKVVEPKLYKDDVKYEDKMAGIKVIECAEKGLIVNAQMEELTDGFELVTIENNTVINNKVSARSLSDFPKLSHYSTYSYPTSIRVKMNKTGNGQIVKVNFTTYLKNTLPNEWMGSWNSEALKAGAYCVKMVGIYRVLKPVSSSGGYDVTQSTQYYKPNSAYSTTSAAIDSIKNYGMADTYGLLFYPEYRSGTSGVIGTKASGIMQQYGSQALAKKGYTYKQILNYYYSGSEYSSGDVKLFGYNIGF